MVSSIRGGVGLGVGSWFDDNVRRVIGGGGTTYFWTDNWVGGVPLLVRFPCLFYLSVDKGVTWRLWRVESGVLVAVLGCGWGAFLRGRRSVSGSVVLCCMILFCRIILWTGGDGCSIPFLAIQWKGLIISLHQWRSLLLGVYLMMYGISMFRLKFLCWLGDFFATGFPRRIILWGVVSFITMLISVLEGAIYKRLLHTYF